MIDSNELYHYGVLGMKWGVRHDRDRSGRLTNAGKKLYSAYGSNKQAKRKRKAQKYYDRANENQSKIDVLNMKRNGVNWVQKRKIDKNIKKLEKKKKQNLKDAEAKEQGKLTKKQKYVLVGASIVAAYATYKFVDSGASRQLIEKGKAALTKSTFSFKKNESLASKNFDIDGLKKNVVDQINPNYGQLGTKNNCRRCTFAYEMRRRGYDVSAVRTLNGTGQAGNGLYNATNKKNIRGGKLGVVSTSFKTAFTEGEQATRDLTVKFVGTNISAGSSGFGKSVFNTLAKQPNGARGELGIGWKSGGGHSIAWEIVNNKPVIFDCQTNEVFDSAEKFAKYSDHMNRASFTRLDNIELDEDFLMRWVRNA